VALPDTVSQEDLEQAVRTLNEDPKVHGILVQLPLPEHINAEAVLAAISVAKAQSTRRRNNARPPSITTAQPL
jgi:5,10-methylene-tetrahydrofolate dehydrogenase/methenyl tetrahydrofolate cyclohydrolase